MRKYLPYFLIFVFITIALLIFLLGSGGVKFNTVTVPGKFSITVPESLSKTDSIDSHALLEYKNEKDQVFLLLYEEKDSSRSLKPFFEKCSADLIAGMGNGNLTTYYPEKINGIDAMVGNIRGSVNETGVHYRIAVLDAEGTFYKLIAGTTDRNHSRYSGDINEIIRSFRLYPAQ